MKLTPAMLRVLGDAADRPPLFHRDLAGGDKIAANTLSYRGFLRGVDAVAGDGSPALAWEPTEAGAAVLAGLRAEVEADRTRRCRCRRCGRRLTDQTSIARGIGPECFDRINGKGAAPAGSVGGLG